MLIVFYGDSTRFAAAGPHGRTSTISARSGEKVQLQQGQSFSTIGQQFPPSDEFYNRAAQQA